jgi:hypothetical protein
MKKIVSSAVAAVLFCFLAALGYELVSKATSEDKQVWAVYAAQPEQAAAKDVGYWLVILEKESRTTRWWCGGLFGLLGGALVYLWLRVGELEETKTKVN